MPRRDLGSGSGDRLIRRVTGSAGVIAVDDAFNQLQLPQLLGIELGVDIRACRGWRATLIAALNLRKTVA